MISTYVLIKSKHLYLSPKSTRKRAGLSVLSTATIMEAMQDMAVEAEDTALTETTAVKETDMEEGEDVTVVAVEAVVALVAIAK